MYQPKLTSEHEMSGKHMTIMFDASYSCNQICVISITTDVWSLTMRHYVVFQTETF